MTPVTPAPRKLTVHMEAALSRALREDGIRRVWDDKPGKPQWPAPPQTIHVLVRDGLLKHSRVRNRKGWEVDLWRITPAGELALDPPKRPLKDTVHGMRAKGAAQTRVMAGGVWVEIALTEPEKVNPDDLRVIWSREAKGRHETARGGARRVAGDLSKRLRAA